MEVTWRSHDKIGAYFFITSSEMSLCCKRDFRTAELSKRIVCSLEKAGGRGRERGREERAKGEENVLKV